MASGASRVGIMVLSIAQIVFLISALGSVGFFLNELNAAFEKVKSGAPGQVAQLLSLFLTGLYGREEFFLCSASVALVVALCSLIIGITRSHNKAPCAAFMMMIMKRTQGRTQSRAKKHV
ncbi:uncharacterized protein LOC124434389 [Xenia sp. Carnegie-2017]|uniref:uncharacterized protein LOC124434389 n=1 Tax=Xenia sp. Carnegie-2017 TaxID=2897299 RepID=UPI001F03E78D|nr:uncharacterized protein LOC124434389 [Xenia sp. Carnegie-2017]